MTGSLPFDTRFNNGGEGKLRVPGFGLPLEYWPTMDGDLSEYPQAEFRFRHGTNDFGGERLTYKERSMLQLMDAITDKKDWNRKVFTDEVVAKWKQEAMSANQLISDKAFDWCITEIKDKAKQYERTGYVITLNAESACVKSDSLIDDKLQAELKAAVQPLQNNPDKDWHPNTDDQVLNLVHPSLYPLVYGRTRVLESGVVNLSDISTHIGKGQATEANQFVNAMQHASRYRLDNSSAEKVPNKALWSNRFQWLPAEVKFKGEEGTEVEFTSYINNLHPVKHTELYHVIEKLISKSIPLWNEVLIQGQYGRYPERIKTFSVEFEPKRPSLSDLKGGDDNSKGDDDDEDDEELRQKVRDYVALPNAPDYEADEDDDQEIPDDWETNEEYIDDWPLWRVLEAKWKMLRQLIHPEPGVAYTYEDWTKGDVDNAVVLPDGYSKPRKHEYYQVKLEERFRERGLQVIVKLAGVELTPDKPEYEGGSWHLEGMLNEHIVATAIYYYDVENTTESGLHFRQEDIFHELSVYYEQHEHYPLFELYGMDGDDFETGISELGTVSTPGGRLLVFPNTLQHAVSGFKLEDPSKPGHRRFLVLWLVDPHLRIMSTANVPPQQHDWWAPSAAANSGINRFPAEIGKTIMDNTDDWPMSLEKAKELRLDLMEERTAFGDAVEGNFLEWNLCEH